MIMGWVETSRLPSGLHSLWGGREPGAAADRRDDQVQRLVLGMAALLDEVLGRLVLEPDLDQLVGRVGWVEWCSPKWAQSPHCPSWTWIMGDSFPPALRASDDATAATNPLQPMCHPVAWPRVSERCFPLR